MQCPGGSASHVVKGIKVDATLQKLLSSGGLAIARSNMQEIALKECAVIQLVRIGIEVILDRFQVTSTFKTQTFCERIQSHSGDKGCSHLSNAKITSGMPCAPAASATL